MKLRRVIQDDRLEEAATEVSFEPQQVDVNQALSVEASIHTRA
jgi:hypothetical protein